MLKTLTRDGWLHWVITLQLVFIAAAAGWLVAGSALSDRENRPGRPGVENTRQAWDSAIEMSAGDRFIQD